MWFSLESHDELLHCPPVRHPVVEAVDKLSVRHEVLQDEEVERRQDNVGYASDLVGGVGAALLPLDVVDDDTVVPVEHHLIVDQENTAQLLIVTHYLALLVEDGEGDSLPDLEITNVIHQVQHQVLLVDMKVKHRVAHPDLLDQPECSLTENENEINCIRDLHSNE